MFSVCGNIKYTGDGLVKSGSLCYLAVLMWVAVSRVCCCRKNYLLGPCKSKPYSVFRLQSLEVGDDN